MNHWQEWSAKLLPMIYLLMFFLLIMALMVPLLRCISNWENKKQFIRACRIKVKQKYLFTWIGDEPSIDHLLFEIVGNLPPKYKFNDNLVLIKERTKQTLGNGLDDYYLLVEILKQRLNNSLAFLMGKISKIIIPSSFLTVIGFFIKMELLDPPVAIIGLTGFTIISFIFLISYIGILFIRERNRIEILIIVLERIIKELERDEKRPQVLNR